MAKKTSQRISKFAKQTQQAQIDGYVPMPIHYHGTDTDKNGTPDTETALNATLAQACGADTPAILAGKTPQGIMNIPSANGNEIPTADNIGTSSLGYIEWGPGNRLPNAISNLSALLPYTATAAKFNVDAAAGMGFVPKYRYSTISNGALVSRKIDFADAGTLLEQQLLDARLALLNFQQQHYPSENTDSSLQQTIEHTYTDRITALEKALNTWKQVNQEVETFIAHNNLPLLAIHLFNDMVLFNLCFPELELSQNATDQTDTARWTPKVTGISYRDAHTCRLEKMDEQGNINFVYHSNRWLDQPNTATTLKDEDITALPAINPEHPTESLTKKIRDFKIKYPKAKPADRPTRFIYPASIPTSGRVYYPQPSWHSIFGGDVFSYLATIVSDRYTRRKNKNIIGHIIYVHQDYIKQLMLQQQQELSKTSGRKAGTGLTEEEKKQVLDTMWNEINSFLSNRNNAGQPLLAYSFTGTDGKEHDAYRIVDVPNTTAKDANAQKTELEEISGIVFFALQCHPELIGAVPGRTGAGGGTYQRELFLLKQVQMASTQQLVIRVLDTIAQFNGWTNLTWDIRQQVLTTLDNSKTGLTDSQTN